MLEHLWGLASSNFSLEDVCRHSKSPVNIWPILGIEAGLNSVLCVAGAKFNAGERLQITGESQVCSGCMGVDLVIKQGWIRCCLCLLKLISPHGKKPCYVSPLSCMGS